MPAPLTSVPGETRAFPSAPPGSPQLPSTHPFDAAAGSYDVDFTRTQLARWLREAVWDVLGDLFAPGDQVLELGCGTGEDAVWLARRGVRVTATDASTAMLDAAQRKAAAASVSDLIDFAAIDLSAMPATDHRSLITDHRPPFTGAFSNFGPLNCLADRRPLAAALAGWIQPGGKVVLVVMGPTCPWEIGWHLLHGKPRAAFRRFGSGVEAHVGDGATIPVWYPSPRTLAREFSHDFEVTGLRGIGSALPPSYLSHLVERQPALFGKLAKLDRRIGAMWPATWLNDHYLMVLKRR